MEQGPVPIWVPHVDDSGDVQVLKAWDLSGLAVAINVEREQADAAEWTSTLQTVIWTLEGHLIGSCDPPCATCRGED